MMDISRPLEPDEAARIGRALAEKVVALGLVTPALLVLEMHRPLSRLAGQALVAATPVLAPVFGLSGVESFSRLLYHPGGIDLLADAIDEMANAKSGEPA